jgi:hypothetical protein
LNNEYVDIPYDDKRPEDVAHLIMQESARLRQKGYEELDLNVDEGAIYIYAFNYTKKQKEQIELLKEMNKVIIRPSKTSTKEVLEKAGFSYKTFRSLNKNSLIKKAARK